MGLANQFNYFLGFESEIFVTPQDKEIHWIVKIRYLYIQVNFKLHSNVWILVD